MENLDGWDGLRCEATGGVFCGSFVAGAQRTIEQKRDASRASLVPGRLQLWTVGGNLVE
jgi:hypothetical protein